MYSLDRLEKQRQQEQQKKKNIPSPDEEVEEEMDMPGFVPLNRAKSAFDGDADKAFGGINTEKSVFAKTAVFPDAF